MARTATKRGSVKAESASKRAKANGKTKVEEKDKGKGQGRPRKIEALESSASSLEGDGDENDDLLEALSQSQSSVDSEGIASTRQFLKEVQNMVEKTEKKDTFQKEFEKEVRDEEKRLLALLGELEEERRSETEGFHNEFASLLAEALSPPGVDDEKEDPMSLTSSSPSSTALMEYNSGSLIKYPSVEANPLYVTSRKLMDEFRATLAEYDELAHKTANCQPPEDYSEAWEKDYAEVRRIISAGRKATEAEVKTVLTYDGKGRHSTEKRKRQTDKDEFVRDEHLQAMLEMGREGQKSKKSVYGWGNAAHSLEKGFRRLVRTLPDEE